jgi:hypothetical protein
MWRAGNAAVSRLFDRAEAGRPLEPANRSWLERLFHADLRNVRVHDDAHARDAAAGLDAAALTSGEDIFLGTAQTGDLLAHEVSHVLQQRQAANVDTDRVGEAGDGHEQAAEQAVTSGRAPASSGASVPGVQRQAAGNRATRAEVQVALTTYLNRVLAAQGGTTLHVTQQVRDAVLSLARGDPLGSIPVEVWLRQTALPGDPGEFAAQAASKLPPTVDRALLDRLSQLPTGPEPPGRLGRLKDLVEKSAPGGPEERNEPKEPTSEERFERTVEDVRRAQGKPVPTTYGPYSVDVLRLGRIAQGLPGAWRGPAAQPAAGPQARSYPDVDKAIQQIAADALVPAAARGKPEASNYADAREVASDLARRLDIAQQQHSTAVDVRLGINYASLTDRGDIESQLARIVAIIRDALPHHATSVRQVNVFYGDRLARWIPVSPGAR